MGWANYLYFVESYFRRAVYRATLIKKTIDFVDAKIYLFMTLWMRVESYLYMAEKESIKDLL